MDGRTCRAGRTRALAVAAVLLAVVALAGGDVAGAPFAWKSPPERRGDAPRASLIVLSQGIHAGGENDQPPGTRSPRVPGGG